MELAAHGSIASFIREAARFEHRNVCSGGRVALFLFKNFLSFFIKTLPNFSRTAASGPACLLELASSPGK